MVQHETTWQLHQVNLMRGPFPLAVIIFCLSTEVLLRAVWWRRVAKDDGRKICRRLWSESEERGARGREKRQEVSIVVGSQIIKTLTNLKNLPTIVESTAYRSQHVLLLMNFSVFMVDPDIKSRPHVFWLTSNPAHWICFHLQESLSFPGDLLGR